MLAFQQPWSSTESQEHEASLAMHIIISSGPQFLITVSALSGSDSILISPGSKDIRSKHCQGDSRTHRLVTTSVIASLVISEAKFKRFSLVTSGLLSTVWKRV